MKTLMYKGITIDIYKRKNMSRVDENGRICNCDGFHFELFSDAEKQIHIATFVAAIGFEMPEKPLNYVEFPIEIAENYVREVIDVDFKESKNE